MTIEERSRLVFHGSKLPPYTESTVLNPPKLEQPLFVADNPKGALFYVAPNDRKNKSIFVFRLKDYPSKLAFDYTNPGHRAKLSKYPALVDFIENYIMVYGISFYIGSIALASIVQECGYAHGSPDGFKFPEDAYVKYTCNWRFKNCLEELGVVEKLPDGMYKFNLMIDAIRYPVILRRLIKAKIFKIVHDLGFRMFMDKDTTGNRFKGHEYAIFDMDVIEDGISMSMPVSDIRKNIEYAYPKGGTL